MLASCGVVGEEACAAPLAGPASPGELSSALRFLGAGAGADCSLASRSIGTALGAREFARGEPSTSISWNLRKS